MKFLKGLLLIIGTAITDKIKNTSINILLFTSLIFLGIFGLLIQFPFLIVGIMFIIILFMFLIKNDLDISDILINTLGVMVYFTILLITVDLSDNKYQKIGDINITVKQSNNMTMGGEYKNIKVDVGGDIINLYINECKPGMTSVYHVYREFCDFSVFYGYTTKCEKEKPNKYPVVILN